jgi:membrane-associated phospholipid phosphatase
MFRLFFVGILQNLRAIFSGKSLVVHCVAIGVTAILVFSGADWAFFEATRSELLYWVIMTAGVGGFFTPVIIPLVMYLFGEFKKRHDLMVIGAAAGQSAILAYLISITYKAFTGRMEPEFLTHFNTIDNSRAFNFGFLEHGVFWGWPSSHTAVAFAGAFAIILLTRNKVARVGAFFYACFIGTGAAVGFHWLSDVLAGALIGALVGAVVARSFRSQK